MLFRKRRKSGSPPQQERRVEGGSAPRYYTVEYDQMMKGVDVMRHGRRVRQFAVMVGGNVRVVTSGDTVDLETYQALVAAGAMPPLPARGVEDDAAQTPVPPSAEDAPPESAVPETGPPHTTAPEE